MSSYNEMNIKKMAFKYLQSFNNVRERRRYYKREWEYIFYRGKIDDGLTHGRAFANVIVRLFIIIFIFISI